MKASMLDGPDSGVHSIQDNVHNVPLPILLPVSNFQTNFPSIFEDLVVSVYLVM